MSDDRPCWREIGTSGDGSCRQLRQNIHCRNCESFARGARMLFDRPAPGDYVEDWTRWLVDEADEVETDQVSLCLFRLAAEWFALPTGMLSQGVESRAWRRIPHRNRAGLLGLVNVGGDLILCFSLHALLEVDRTPDAEAARRTGQRPGLLVCGEPARRFAFPTDDTLGVQRISRHDMTPPPATIRRAERALTASMVELDFGTIAVLDPQRLLGRIEDVLA